MRKSISLALVVIVSVIGISLVILVREGQSHDQTKIAIPPELSVSEDPILAEFCRKISLSSGEKYKAISGKMLRSKNMVP